jgi:hypothetical protein
VNIPNRKDKKAYPLEDAIRTAVSNLLYEAFVMDDDGIGKLDKWTQRRIRNENMAKIALVLESDDPAEHCYQNLIREIDSEAENGIYLVGTETQNDELRELADDPGISGLLRFQIRSVAKSLYPDELEHSTDDLDLVWVTVQAGYDRARLDASVSELAMRFLSDSAEATDDMTKALRALSYAFHEDMIRRVTDLPSLLGERESRDLLVMVLELEKRCGSYEDRIRLIEERAESL